MQIIVSNFFLLIQFVLIPIFRSADSLVAVSFFTFECMVHYEVHIKVKKTQFTTFLLLNCLSLSPVMVMKSALGSLKKQ